MDDFIKEYKRRKDLYGLKDHEIAKKLSTGIKNIHRFEKGNYNPSYKFLSTLTKIMGGNLKILFDDKNTISFSNEVVNWFESISKKTNESYDEIAKNMLKGLFFIQRGKSLKEALKENYEVYKNVFESLEDTLLVDTHIKREDVKDYLYLLKNCTIDSIIKEKFEFKLKNHFDSYTFEKSKSTLTSNKITFSCTINLLNKEEIVGHIKTSYKILLNLNSKKIKDILKNKMLKDSYKNKIITKEILPEIKKSINVLLENF
ncbi:hypothetical protein OSSY52_02030 [Tepiditoga spiralis]|uniref:HTH cro/C1-type domain-containing protein n=1 Tax=Tepiditoga spiralis TaxID=2108365 RepID=A0A7G1G7R9_9BACT|nr:hypothetical protein [Tepiditoga spiralis]BBE30062.1 hypothetical protein OSSY52_02030 [Tepiditoga spiralis]